MLATLRESILTPTSVMWLVAAVIAAGILFGSINRRRAHLTDSLREFVDRNKLGSNQPPANHSPPETGGDRD